MIAEELHEDTVRGCHIWLSFTTNCVTLQTLFHISVSSSHHKVRIWWGYKAQMTLMALKRMDIEQHAMWNKSYHCFPSIGYPCFKVSHVLFFRNHLRRAPLKWKKKKKKRVSLKNTKVENKGHKGQINSSVFFPPTSLGHNERDKMSQTLKYQQPHVSPYKLR